MSADEGKALMRNFINEWNKGDLETQNMIIEETVDVSFVNHSAANAEEARPGRCKEGVTHGTSFPSTA